MQSCARVVWLLTFHVGPPPPPARVYLSSPGYVFRVAGATIAMSSCGGSLSLFLVIRYSACGIAWPIWGSIYGVVCGVVPVAGTAVPVVLSAAYRRYIGTTSASPYI